MKSPVLMDLFLCLEINDSTEWHQKLPIKTSSAIEEEHVLKGALAPYRAFSLQEKEWEDRIYREKSHLHGYNKAA